MTIKKFVHLFIKYQYELKYSPTSSHRSYSILFQANYQKDKGKKKNNDLVKHLKLVNCSL